MRARFRIGNGNQVSFRNDYWHELGPLYSNLPLEFVLSNRIDVSVEEAINEPNRYLGSIVRTSSNLQPLLEIQLDRKDDEVDWKWSIDKTFTVKKAYLFFSNGGINSHFAKTNWRLPLPLKFKIFNWLAYQNKILTTAT